MDRTQPRRRRLSAESRPKSDNISKKHLLATIPSRDASADEATEWLVKVLQRRAHRTFREFSSEAQEESGRYEHILFLLGSDIWNMSEEELYQAMPPALPSRLARMVARDIVKLRTEASTHPDLSLG
ncbi:hypothetical protein MFIFM68171_01707 [Madurella fahalii]|uniref:Uncharacterized protein n=1 Tax=Madurella fahalii TaxID=1157608 RepID=A0ABQ0G160_9PEZI